MLYNACSKCKYKIHAESPKSHNSYFVARTCIRIYFLPAQWKRCTKLFISLLDTCTCVHSTGLKGKETMGCSVFPFVVIFNISGWQIQGSNTCKKDMIGFLGYLCFLKCDSVLKVSSEWNQKGGLYWLSAVIEVTYLSFTCFESTGILCFWSASNTVCKWGSKMADAHCVSPFLFFCKYHAVLITATL